MPNYKQTIAVVVAAKLEDGNIRAVARILCYSDAPATICEETLAELCLKQPVPSHMHIPSRLVVAKSIFHTRQSQSIN